MNPQQRPDDPVKHVVLLLFENHSFDQMLGCFKQVYTNLDGVDPNQSSVNRVDGTEYPQKVKGVSGTDFYSVDHSIRAWVKANGCKEEPVTVELPEKAKDGTKVTCKTYGDGKGGVEVVLVVIEGGGHTWPGLQPKLNFLGKSTKNISANDLMWEFLQRHPIKSLASFLLGSELLDDGLDAFAGQFAGCKGPRRLDLFAVQEKNERAAFARGVGLIKQRLGG